MTAEAGRAIGHPDDLDPHPGTSDDLRERWLAVWPQALAAWGTLTRLHPPVLHSGEKKPSSVRSFAWFSTVEVEVNIDLDDVRRMGLEDHAVAVLAHEIGHHVLAPGDLTTSARLVARSRAGLVNHDDHAHMLANLWTDLLIDDRLQRRAGLDMARLARAMGPGTHPIAQVLTRAQEILWGLPRQTLTHPDRPVPEREASLCARLARAYADDPVGGMGGFALLMRGFLDADEPLDADQVVTCEQHEPTGSLPSGIATDPSLTLPVLHPALDPQVVGDLATPDLPDEPAADEETTAEAEAAQDAQGSEDSPGQHISPADYDATLRLLGLGGSSERSAARWYRENAMRYLVPFPVRTVPATQDPLLGGYEVWDVGDDLTDVDWAGSVLQSPVVIPGVTTVRRTYEEQDDVDPIARAVDLDLYLDSSGSMPNPQHRLAPIALAGAVLALSALRAGARVQATTWSGPQQIAGTDGFVRDEDRVLAAIVAHFGGSTSFPLHLLERTYLAGPRMSDQPGDRPGRTHPTHIAVISDDGISSMFLDLLGRMRSDEPTEPVVPELTVAAKAVRAAGGGGSLILQTSPHTAATVREYAPGYDVYDVQTTEDLVRFAKDFARTLWTTGGGARGPR